MPIDHTEFQDAAEEGLVDADRAARYIMGYVATRDELNGLLDECLTIQDMLNGGYTGDQEHDVHTLMRKWNERLGFRFFNLV